MQSDEFTEQVDSVKGQTDMADYVSLTDQRRMRITLPPIELQRHVAPKLAIIDEAIATKAAQIGTLARLRDILLPQLMSGALRVRQAEKLVEAN